MRPTAPLKLAAAALAAAALAPAVAGAAPAVDGTFDLPSTPHRLALGPDGNVWVTLDGLTDNIARVAPDGAVRTFTSPAIVSPIGIVAGPDGQLWVTESGAVAHFSPSDPSAARRVAVADVTSPQGIAVGPDGNLWTASNDEVIRIGTDERFTAFRPAGLVGARGIAAGGDGNLYVADFGGAQVVGVTTAGVQAGLFPTGGGPQEVAAGPGGQIGFTNPTNVPQQVGRFAPPDTRSVQTTDVPGTDPFGMAYATDGAYWVANFANDTLTRMTPAGAVTTLAGFPRGSGPRYLATGRDGTLWVGLERSRQVARVSGVVAPSGGGGTPGGDADATAPVLSHVRLPRALRRGKAGTLRLRLSEAATVRIRFERRLPGRRTAGRCVAPARARHGKRCIRFVKAGIQRRSAAQGANRLKLGGRVGKRVLPAGRYRVTLVATDAAGNASKPLMRRLRVLPARRR